MKNGILAAIATYILWGFLPIYWKSLHGVPALEILCHRTVWSFALLLLLLAWRKHWHWLRQTARSPITLITFLGTAGLLAINWFTYIWAVDAGRIVDASLGYFINPLLNVLLGMLFLGERLRFWQGVAIAVAAGGVIFLALGYGSLPWIALTLALTFGLYGLLRKTASLSAFEGLSLEMIILFLPALAYLLYLELAGTASFGHAGTGTTVLLAFTGVVTALPLFLFAYGARRITLTTVGILQYIAPTMQFLLGTLVYGEPFSSARLIGFGAVWVALLIYSLEGLVVGRKHKSSLLSAT